MKQATELSVYLKAVVSSTVVFVVILGAALALNKLTYALVDLRIIQEASLFYYALRLSETALLVLDAAALVAILAIGTYRFLRSILDRSDDAR